MMMVILPLAIHLPTLNQPLANKPQNITQCWRTRDSDSDSSPDSSPFFKDSDSDLDSEAKDLDSDSDPKDSGTRLRVLLESGKIGSF